MARKKLLNPKATYSAFHKWLSRNHKKKGGCQHCGSTRFLEWALKKGKMHGHDVERYLTLCSSCHKIYDYTDARRDRLSQVMTGREIVWSGKISSSLRGRKLSEIHRRKISDYQKQNPRRRNNKGQFF